MPLDLRHVNLVYVNLCEHDCNMFVIAATPDDGDKKKLFFLHFEDFTRYICAFGIAKISYTF